MLSEKVIEIRSVITDGEGNEDVIEMNTIGKYGIKDGKVYLSYDDSSSVGVDDVTTILRAENDFVVLKRTGALESRLEIEKGERHQCHYSTQFGDILVGIFGETIDIKLNETGGKLLMEYTIDVNSQLLSKNNVEITVKEV